MEYTESDWNENLEIEGDRRDEIRDALECEFSAKIHADAIRELDGFEHLETADDIAEYETWLDQGDFEDDIESRWQGLDPDYR